MNGVSKSEQQVRVVIAAAEKVLAPFVDRTTSRVFGALRSDTGSVGTVALEGRQGRLLIASIAERVGVLPRTGIINLVRTTLEVRAQRRRIALSLRFARDGDEILLDLGDPSWSQVRVGRDGWRIEPHAEPVFRRSDRTLPHPGPDEDARPHDLPREIARVIPGVSADTRDLLAAFLPHALATGVPRYALSFTGPEGGGKSAASKVVAAVLDPATPETDSLPSDPRDFDVVADQRAVLVFDNVSALSKQQSDLLAKVVTGHGSTRRRLGTNREASAFQSKAVVILNGITIAGVRLDLADRIIEIPMPSLGGRYRSEEELQAEFEFARPRLLGAVLAAASGMLRQRPAVATVHRDVLRRFRMQDAATSMCAAAEAIGIGAGRMIELLASARDRGKIAAIEDDIVGAALLAFMRGRVGWDGLVGELYGACSPPTRTAGWPTSARAFGHALRRLSASLPAVGIAVEFLGHGRDGHRIRVCRVDSVTTVTTVTNRPRALPAPRGMA